MSDKEEAVDIITFSASSATRQAPSPRSRLVEAIAVLLLARPMRAAEIAQVVGKPTRYVSSYLSYWRTRGLFDYENGFWTLTPEGEEFARTVLEKEMNSRVTRYAALARQILEGKAGDEPLPGARKGKKTRSRAAASGQPLPFIVSKNISPGNKQQGPSPTLCTEALLSGLELSDDERSVLEALLAHYFKWGMTYTYLDQLEQDMEADRVWLLTTLRRLQAKGLVYIYNDKRLGVRIGLSRRMKELLSSCSSQG